MKVKSYEVGSKYKDEVVDDENPGWRAEKDLDQLQQGSHHSTQTLETQN